MIAPPFSTFMFQLVEDIDRLGRKVEQIKPPSPYTKRRIGYIIDED